MDSQSSSLRRSAAGLLLLLAVVGAGPATATIIPTAGTIKDFTFVEGEVNYDIPLIADMGLVLSSGNDIELTVRGADGNTGVFEPASGFTAKLSWRANLDRNIPGFVGGEFMVFGSLPSAEDSDRATLMAGTLDAMQADGDSGSLAFLFSGQTTTGTLAQQYQSIGIYAHVAGLDDVVWARGYMDQPGSIVGTLGDASMGRQNAPSPTAAIPVPATPLLILAGLFGLGYRQRRNNKPNASQVE